MHVIYHLAGARSRETVEDLRHIWQSEEERRRPSQRLPQITYQRYEVRRGGAREIVESVRKSQPGTSVVVGDFKQLEECIPSLWEALCERIAHQVKVYVLRPYIILDPRSEETAVWLPIVKKMRQSRVKELKEPERKPEEKKASQKDRHRSGVRISYDLQEKIIHAYLKLGNRTKDIAEALDVSLPTVKRYIKRYKEGLKERRPYKKVEEAKNKNLWSIPLEDIQAMKLGRDSTLFDAVTTYLHSLNTETTARICYGCLDKFFRWWCDRHVKVLTHAGEIRPGDGSDYYRFLQGQYKPSTTSLHMGMIKSFLKYCLEMKYSDINPFAAIKVKSYKSDQVKADPLTREEIKRLLEYMEEETRRSAGAEHYEEKIRNEVLINLFLSSGMRVGSLQGIRLGDLSFSDLKVKILIEIKGGREASVTLGRDMRDLLKKYIREMFGEEPDPSCYLLPFDIDHKKEPMSYSQIAGICTRAGTGASVMGKLTTHRFRATFATLMYKDGVDLVEIKTRLNHSNITQLSQYIKPKLEPNEPSWMKKGG